ncbi:MAG TPA: LuxR family transcriptional regulator [Nocardioidaceae bacterium]|jgi:quercetin dioxygenase-like cupin family protein|nr:LuxR family transcriptional regulator [Nocardioidaceae bacterium]
MSPRESLPLQELVAQLLAELPDHAAGRTARTVLSGTVMRAVVIALRDGTELAEHDSPAAATLQVLRGRVTLHAGEQSWPVAEGELLPVPPQRHSVRAHGDAAVLLTVALH